jgi:hypothetical protein
MNVDIYLLFNLTIPLEYHKKLQKYYYIPENRTDTLKLGGFVYLVDKMIPYKNLYYPGILLKNSENTIHFKDNKYTVSELNQKYHVFYRPKITKLKNAITLLNSIEI